MVELSYSAVLVCTLALVQISLGQTQCCNGKNGRTTAPSGWPATQSPAGGPAANSQAAVCIFYRGTNCLVCRKGSSTSKCCTAIPSESDDTKYGGPTPYNEYLIGQRRTNPTYNIDWYNLYPRKEAPLTGYYSYYQSTAAGRSTMGLHPGTVSLGCVTVKGDSCWVETKSVLESGSMMYRNSGYSGFLYVMQ